MVCFLDTPLSCLFETELHAKIKIEKKMKRSAYLFYLDRNFILLNNDRMYLTLDCTI